MFCQWPYHHEHEMSKLMEINDSVTVHKAFIWVYMDTGQNKNTNKNTSSLSHGFSWTQLKNQTKIHTHTHCMRGSHGQSNVHTASRSGWMKDSALMTRCCVQLVLQRVEGGFLFLRPIQIIHNQHNQSKTWQPARIANHTIWQPASTLSSGVYQLQLFCLWWTKSYSLSRILSHNTNATTVKDNAIISDKQVILQDDQQQKGRPI